MAATPPQPPAAAGYARAVEAVNAWRGRCLASFAAVEAQVTETLVTLAARDPAVALPHLVGQRCNALVAAFARAGATEAIEPLTAWQTHDPLRVYLCHGVARITVGREGDWQAVFNLVALRSRRVHRTFMVIDEAEGERLVRALARGRQRLDVRLRPLRGDEGGAAPPALRIGILP